MGAPLASRSRHAERDSANGISARLGLRRSEIEQAALTRVHAVADPIEAADPEYVNGLRLAVSAALDYGLAAIEHGEENAPPVPTTLLAQARLAARSGVNLDTVLRRYFAGYTLFSDFLMQEASGEREREQVQGMIQTQAALFDRLIAAVSEEYERERKTRPLGSEQRRAERIARLLAGELVDASEIGYGLDGHHLAVIAAGPEAVEVLNDLGQLLDRRVLAVRRGDATVWAWLGGRREIGADEIERVQSEWPAGLPAALGEPAKGRFGWQLTHRQAKAALPVALRGAERIVRYADVALLASMLHDDVLTVSLRTLYLAPLSEERDGGEALRETLRAYFAAQRNGASAAAALGVTRQTVKNRLRAVEERIGRSLAASANELEAALRLEHLAVPAVSPSDGPFA